MSLDPRDSRRRGRSKSPGRRRDDDDGDGGGRRSHSKIRAPSPPPSSYDREAYEERERELERLRGYEDRDRDRGTVVDAEPRGYGGGGRGEYGGGGPGYGQPAGQYAGYGPPTATMPSQPYGAPGYAAPSTSQPYGAPGYAGPTTGAGPQYGMPGAFTSMPSVPDVGARYATSGATGREKDYYAEKYGDDREKERDRYGKRDEYVRDASPSRREKKDKKDRKDRRYADSDDDDEPRRGSRYEDEKEKYKYRGGEYDKRGDDAYGKDKYDEEKYRKDKYRDDKYGKDAYKEDKYGRDERGGRDRAGSFDPASAHYRASQHARPPSPSDFAPPGALGKPSSYAEPPKWEYAQPSQDLTYSRREEPTSRYGAQPPVPAYAAQPGYGGGYQPDSARTSKSQIVTVEPGSRNKRDASPGPGAYRRDASPAPGLNRGMHSLTVGTGHHGSASLSLATAPGSPLLESYHGTYQSISPMPSPLMIANVPHTDVNLIEALSPESDSDDDRRGKKRRNARFHDPADEAKILREALKGDKRGPDIEPLIEILPGLTHEQILDLRSEYKKIVKTGSEKKGVNIAKHIKLRLKEEDPSLMKACYACALGKWESEAYWANFWYQGEKSRRELLIESLMGRTNREIGEIKDGFSDKKYSDSLTKCMKMELKEDKFKKAVLMVLEEKKMEDRPGYALDRDLVEDDVRDLYKAVRSEKGGETAMINIVVVRSDTHLKEVLRLYESTYRANFAREMLKKSGNLVGELLAHILNGVINKPVRDALLINHALSLSKSDSIRTELLISRLVRYHWDRPHMEAVKREYRNRYGVEMQKAVREGTRGDWGAFCEELCVRRMGDEVREVGGRDDYRR